MPHPLEAVVRFLEEDGGAQRRPGRPAHGAEAMSPVRHLLAVLLALAAFGLAPGRASAAAFDIPPDLGSYAVLSCQDFTMSGNAMVTSEGSGAAPPATARRTSAATAT